MTECEEVAANMRPPTHLRTMDEFRVFVRTQMDASPQVIDNVAQALWENAPVEGMK